MVTYGRESVADIKADIEGLLSQHWEEIAMYKDKVKLATDWDTYLKMDEDDTFICLAARDEGKLIGYYASFLMPNLHYMNDLFAVNDVLFLHPDYRKGKNAVGLIKYAESFFKDMGASVITIHMKVSNPFDRLLEWLGWDYSERLYSKYIGE